VCVCVCVSVCLEVAAITVHVVHFQRFAVEGL
jgi:hypothetical protein